MLAVFEMVSNAQAYLRSIFTDRRLSVNTIMKFLIYGDLQATDGNDICFLDPTRTLQHYRVEKFFREMARIYKEHGCTGVIDLGDTTDDRSSIPVPTIEVLGAGMSLLPSSDWNFKLTGNHEQYLRNAGINNRRLFEHKFTVVDECEVFDFGSCMAFFCSYSSDFAALSKWILEGAKEYRSKPKLLFGHFEVIGTRLNSGTALLGVPADVLKHFKVCLLGHVHIPQSIGDCIHYVGSPFQQDWGEAGESKRVCILDTSTFEITWVPLAGYPEYRQVSLEKFKTLTLEGQKTEDRYKVVLTSHAETEDFFKHPLFHQAEPVYTYDEAQPTEQQVQEDWTFEGLAKRYIGLVPPSALGIESTPNELLELGKMIASGNI
jgi:hypothetical protein